MGKRFSSALGGFRSRNWNITPHFSHSHPASSVLSLPHQAAEPPSPSWLLHGVAPCSSPASQGALGERTWLVLQVGHPTYALGGQMPLGLPALCLVHVLVPCSQLGRSGVVFKIYQKLCLQSRCVNCHKGVPRACSEKHQASQTKRHGRPFGKFW